MTAVWAVVRALNWLVLRALVWLLVKAETWSVVKDLICAVVRLPTPAELKAWSWVLLSVVRSAVSNARACVEVKAATCAVDSFATCAVLRLAI